MEDTNLDHSKLTYFCLTGKRNPSRLCACVLPSSWQCMQVKLFRRHKDFEHLYYPCLVLLHVEAREVWMLQIYFVLVVILHGRAREVRILQLYLALHYADIVFCIGGSPTRARKGHTEDPTVFSTSDSPVKAKGGLCRNCFCSAHRVLLR
eukprot:15348078-Ditylum_brightwellii.AAC.1